MKIYARWSSASDASLAFVRGTVAQFRVNSCVRKPKEAPSKWARGGECWEKKLELCLSQVEPEVQALSERCPLLVLPGTSRVERGGKDTDKETRPWRSRTAARRTSFFDLRVGELNRHIWTTDFISWAVFLRRLVQKDFQPFYVGGISCHCVIKKFYIELDYMYLRIVNHWLF